MRAVLWVTQQKPVHQEKTVPNSFYAVTVIVSVTVALCPKKIVLASNCPSSAIPLQSECRELSPLSLSSQHESPYIEGPYVECPYTERPYAEKLLYKVTWGILHDLAGSARGQRQQCECRAAALPSQQQQPTGLQCPWIGPTDLPTSSLAEACVRQPGSPLAGPSVPTEWEAGQQLHAPKTKPQWCLLQHLKQPSGQQHPQTGPTTVRTTTIVERIHNYFNTTVMIHRNYC